MKSTPPSFAIGSYANSPFHLDNEKQYQQWKQAKLDAYPQSANDLIVPVNNPFSLTQEELQTLKVLLSKANMAIYAITEGNFEDKKIPESIGLQLGVKNLDKNECADNDNFTSIQLNQQGLHKLYIPYSNKPLNWHTDGYYNRLTEQIYCMLLHCVRPAATGGVNQLLDHEIVYMLLRDKNPDYISALMEADAMTIPKNVLDGKIIRPDRSGPVFSITGQGRLHMRYTARARNVIWKDRPLTLQAKQVITEILGGDCAYIFAATLKPGQGLICNNILHTRTAFSDDLKSPRLLYRGRYYDKLALT